jgi:hypothetical protein
MTRLVYGSSSPTSAPGKLERMVFSSPRMPTGAAGFGSNVSI